MSARGPIPLELVATHTDGRTETVTVTAYPHGGGRMTLVDSDRREFYGHNQTTVLDRLAQGKGWASVKTKRATNRKPYNDRAGYKCSKRSAVGNGWVVIYEATEAGIDVGGLRYAVVCEAHGTNIGESAMPRARLSMKAPENFCDECRKAKGA